MNKIFDFLILFLLFLSLFLGVYLLWLNLPSETVNFESYQNDFSVDLPVRSSQFYSNMRYPESIITYTISKDCNQKQRDDFIKAIVILESKTVLDFKEATNGEISVSCANVNPRPEQKGFFIAGEGGPTEIINASQFSVILSGKISLLRPETCSNPQIALHELLHALGFDHNSNETSIMFPVTNCRQKIDSNIINDINSLYNTPPYADLAVERVSANRTGRFLNFEVVIGNIGLKNINSASLKVFTDGEFVKEFNLEEIDLGAKKKLGISNLRIPRNTQTLTLIAETTEPEISKENNIVEITSISEE